jgi:hypothetical protein
VLLLFSQQGSTGDVDRFPAEGEGGRAPRRNALAPGGDGALGDLLELRRVTDNRWTLLARRDPGEEAVEDLVQ